MSATNSHEKKLRTACVIGAGPAGLSCVKALRDAGVDCVGFEREDDVGGNWYFGRGSSSVYQNTHLISSKRLTEFSDYPMPNDYPPFPSHKQALGYLRGYAREFDLYGSIRLNSTVRRIEPTDNKSGWNVWVNDEEQPQCFENLIIANGHHWSPKLPDYPGEFNGEVMHARQFKEPSVLQGRRVLVVGAGNTGCDIAVEAALHADAAWHSVRRGYHFLPKFLRGRPIDSAGISLQKYGLPLWLRRKIATALVHVAIGRPERFGLPKPDHQLFETHPIINSQLLYQLGHGRLRMKPDLAELAGDEVRFSDGTAESIDLIVYATGYEVRFPFIDEQYLNVQDGLPHLHLHAFHPTRDNLFVIGMIQPNGGLWPLAELQAKLAARCLATAQPGGRGIDWLRQQFQRVEARVDGGIHFLNSARHRIEVDYLTYRQQLEKLVKSMS